MNLALYDIIIIVVGTLISGLLIVILFKRMGKPVVTPNKEQAKELYLKYACNHFYMMKEGEQELYESLGGGDQSQERVWREEFIREAVSKINLQDTLPLWALMNSNAGEAISELINREDYGDDYMKFWFGYTLQKLATSLSYEEGNKKLGLKKAYQLYQEILSEPNGITEDHAILIDSHTQSRFKAATPEGYIRNYTKRKLGEVDWHKFLDPEDLEDFNKKLFTKL